MHAIEFATLIEDATFSTNGQGTGKCPGHDDRKASLSFRDKAGRVEFYCHAGCTPHAILDALGLTKADMKHAPPSRKDRAATRRIVATYDYTDADGTLLYQTVRYAPKDFRQRRPDPVNPDEWIWKLTGIDTTLYRLPEVVAASQVFLVEGEKDADRLCALGVCASTSPMGAKAWKDAYATVLRDKDVIIIPDNDDSGRTHAQRITASLQGIAASVRTLTLADVPPKGDVSDWLDAGHTKAELLALATAPPLAPHAPPSMPTALRPQIIITTDIRQMVDATIDAIQKMPGEPCLYQRGMFLSMITTTGTPPKWLRRPVDMPTIRQVTAPHIRELAAAAAQWTKETEKPALPPDWVIAALMARPGWPFPAIESIALAPTLRVDGSILDRQGYDPETGIFVTYNGTQFPPVPMQPTMEEAQQALRLLRGVFTDFPFAKPCDESAALAAVCSVVARPAVHGHIPVFSVSAHTPGTGKGLLIDCCAMIALGRPAPRMPQTTDEEEERKRIMAIALSGIPLLHIDNILHPFGSPALDQVTTSPTFGDRVLGASDMRETPWNVVLFASGNNLRYRGDIARRLVPIHLDAQTEHPEERTQFTHPQLLSWVEAHRPALLVAALTLLRAFIVAGRPAQHVTPYGSFEEWSDLIRQALLWVGMPDPCEGRQEIEAEGNDDYERHEGLMAAWQDCYGDTSEGRTIAQIVDDIGCRATESPGTSNAWNALRQALGNFDTRFDGKRLDTRILGEAFKRLQGRMIHGVRLVKAGTYRRAIKWNVETIHSREECESVSLCESFSSATSKKREEEEKNKKVEQCETTHTDSQTHTDVCPVTHGAHRRDPATQHCRACNAPCL